MHRKICQTMNKKERVIVSLTSIPGAIPYAVQAIESILNGSMRPDKIVLYLDSEKFPDQIIPPELSELQARNPIVDIRFDPTEMRSYKKLIPALRDFPNDVIVTVDDDIYYPPHTLRHLLRLHQRLPDAILAHRVRKVKPDAPYQQWKKYKWHDFVFKKIHLSRLAMQTGVGGVLYPPHSLDETMLDPELFMSMAPTNDDIWFWAAAVSKGTYVVPLPNGQRSAKEIGKPKELSLKTINLKPGDDRNRDAFDKILAYYPHIKQRIEQEG